MEIKTPSGVIYDDNDIAILTEMFRVGFVRYSPDPFTLRSGIKSNIYVFGREDLTDNPNLEWMLGSKLARVVYANSHDARQQCLIGLPTAGTALAQATAMASLEVKCEKQSGDAQNIAHRIMREVLKRHGAHKGWVNGKPEHLRQRYWIVDNVATDGQTKVDAIPKFEADGYPARQMPVLITIDRQQGAVGRLKNEGFEQIHVAYNLLDITHAFWTLELWPEGVVEKVEEEIHAHQFAA